MAQAVGEFSVINAPEGDVYSFDFTSQMTPNTNETIASVTGNSPGNGSPLGWFCTVADTINGATDPNPTDRLIGAPQFTGNIVSQVGSLFVPNVNYALMAVIYTTFGRTIDLWGFAPCEPVGC